MRFNSAFAWKSSYIVSVLLASNALADWEEYNFDAEGTRYNTDEDHLCPENVGRLVVKWQFPTPAFVSSTPVVVGKTVYAGDYSGKFYALNAKNGALRWMTQVAAPVTASAAIKGNHVIFGDQAGNIYGLNKRNGAIDWQIRPNAHPFAAVYGSPTEIRGKIAITIASNEEFATLDPSYVCCSGRGSIVLLEPNTGNVIWQTYAVSGAEAANGSSGASPWSTPTFDRHLNLIYVTTGNNYSPPATDTSNAVIALDATTGHIVWANQRTPDDVWNFRYPVGGEGVDVDFGDSAQVYTLPSGQRVVGAGQKSGFYHVLDAATGAVVNFEQFLPGGPGGGLFSDSAIANGVVFADGTDGPAFPFGAPNSGNIVAFTGDATTELWRFTVPGAAAQAGVAVANGVVYTSFTNGHFYAVSAQTGAQLLDLTIDASSSGPSVVNGRVYVGTGDAVATYLQGAQVPGSIVSLGLP